MAALRIRAYNMGLGEALLVSVPDRAPTGAERLRHIFIDGGGIQDSSQDDLLAAVLGDVLVVLDGRPLDLYVLTHAHLDRAQGLFYAAQKLGLELPVCCAWLPASSAPDYHTGYPQAGEKWAALCSIYGEIGGYTKALQAAEEEVPPAVRALLLNNNIFGAAADGQAERPPDPSKTADCLTYLRSLAREKTSYVHRETDALDQTHPFEEARLEVWGPEADTSVYYGRAQPMALSVALARGRHAQPRLRYLAPPPGVDTSAFYHLVESRRSSYVANLLAIDQTADNSSIVFALAWRGRRLLFTGDAQIRSWQTMDSFARLQPVDFLKLSHQGSDYGTPAGALLDKILPPQPGAGRERIALIAASPGPAGAETAARLSARGVVVRSVHEESEGGGYVDIGIEENY